MRRAPGPTVESHPADDVSGGSARVRVRLEFWLALGAAALLAGRLRQRRGREARAIKVVIAEYSKDHTRPFWQGLAETYTKQTGVKVDLQVIDWNSIDQQVSTMIQNNQPPDVLNLNSFSSYAKDGLLYAADEVLSARTREDFLESFARGGQYQGKLYGFPILASARAFFYNQDLFARAGVAVPPRTWDEFVHAARKIQALGDGTIGYALPLGPEEAQAEWSIWMWNNGGDWKTGDAGASTASGTSRPSSSSSTSRTSTRSPRSTPAGPTGPTAPSSSSRTARSGWSWASARSPPSSTPRARSATPWARCRPTSRRRSPWASRTT